MRFLKASESQRSKPHRRVEDILKEMGISFMSEESMPPYIVDILIPEFWVALEIDGPFHSKKKDRVRDSWILEYFKLPILRIDATDYIYKGQVKDDVIKFIEQYADDADSRRVEANARR